VEKEEQMYNLIKKIFSSYKNVFMLIMLCSTNVLPKQLTSVQKERQKEMTQAGIQEVDLRENESAKVPDLYTQTQAHEQLPEMRTLIQENFSNQVVPYFDIISRMVTQEAALKNTHYVFYHTTASMFAIMTDLFTQLYFHFNPEAKATADDTFRFLRFQEESTDVSAQEFVAKEMRAHGLIDDKSELQAILLSVNMSLFGNVGSKTESTWRRFLNDVRSLSKPEIFEKMMDTFGLTKKYIKDIMALDDILATKEAMMLQIFIPKEKIDDLVYLAWIRGIPASGPIMEWIKEYQSSKATSKEIRGSLENIGKTREKLAEMFKKDQENPIFRDFMKDLETKEFSAYAFLKAYCNNPFYLPYLNETEGRILFTKEGMLNPASGIKFYSYFTTPREKLEEYTTKLNAIVEKLIAEKESQRSVASKPMPTTATKPKPTAAAKQAPLRAR